jgi:cobyric acid synthase CobQ/L-threonine-O-3-phosphate decarboxylase
MKPRLPSPAAESAPSTHGGDPAATARALGLSSVPAIHLDFSVSINPLGPPPAVAALLGSSLDRITHYPETDAITAAAALARAHQVSPDRILVGNGSTELFAWIVQTLAPLCPAWIEPTYAGYAEVCRAAGRPGLSLRPEISGDETVLSSPDLPCLTRWLSAIHPEVDLLFLGSPNNPTGTLLPPNAVLELARSRPQRWIVLDESFMDFTEAAETATLIRNDLPPNLIVVKSLTKFFAIPGLRLGMACGHPETVRRVEAARLPWSVNALAQAAALELYRDRDYITRSRTETSRLRRLLADTVSVFGWYALPSTANFFLVRLPADQPASRVQRDLLARGILIRSCAAFPGLGERYGRLAVRPEEEIQALAAALRNSPTKPRTPALMVVGTTSHAGKSLTAAALCRYFARKGRRVAPFKAQNMALNSFVTREGGEMGRAQVVQARAAGIEPHTDMNPVLLKPQSEDGSQVIVDGRPIGTMNARSYYTLKPTVRAAALAAYDRLSSRHELIILEGAGSPAEINLLEEDFVNMAMADHAGAHVLLVADIDRGGVFASIFGTVHLLPPRYRRLLKGIIINKFRGDVSLLDSGIQQIERLTGVPVLGVLPFVKDLDLEDEDSLGLDDRTSRAGAALDIVVIRLPHISNYTDFLTLEGEPGVSLRYVERTADLGNPDFIFLPGTKNTRGDLRFLRESGFSEALTAAEARMIPIFGICGGYQMLGTRVSDPHGIEGAPGDSDGLGLLPVTTTLEPEKELAQISGNTLGALPFAAGGTPFKGYEIHAGRTHAAPGTVPAVAVTFRRDTPVLETGGAVSANRLVAGCYVHGLFDDPELRRQLLIWLHRRKGIIPAASAAVPVGSGSTFDRLADLLGHHLDMNRIEGLLCDHSV